MDLSKQQCDGVDKWQESLAIYPHHCASTGDASVRSRALRLQAPTATHSIPLRGMSLDGSLRAVGCCAPVRDATGPSVATQGPPPSGRATGNFAPARARPVAARSLRLPRASLRNAWGPSARSEPPGCPPGVGGRGFAPRYIIGLGALSLTPRDYVAAPPDPRQRLGGLRWTLAPALRSPKTIITCAKMPYQAASYMVCVNFKPY